MNDLTEIIGDIVYLLTCHASLSKFSLQFPAGCYSVTITLSSTCLRFQWTTTTNSSACYNSNSSVFVFFSFVIIIQNIPSIRRDDFFLNNSSYFNIHLFYTFVFQCNLRPVCATAIQSLFLTAGPTRSQTTTNISSVALRVVCRISWIMSFHLRFISWITLEQ